MSVYILQHVHEFPNGEDDVKIIGVYSTQESAEAAIRRLSVLPGFFGNVSGFAIDGYEVDKDHWTEGFVSTGIGD